MKILKKDLTRLYTIKYDKKVKNIKNSMRNPFYIYAQYTL